MSVEQYPEKSYKTTLEEAYQGRHTSPAPDIARTATASTDHSVDREIIQRVRYVFDQILSMLPKSAEKDMRYVAMKTMMYESLKDLARIDDEQIVMMTGDMANALMFVAHGSMEELKFSLEEEANAGN
jgi:hypothetical protein